MYQSKGSIAPYNMFNFLDKEATAASRRRLIIMLLLMLTGCKPSIYTPTDADKTAYDYVHSHDCSEIAHAGPYDELDYQGNIVHRLGFYKYHCSDGGTWYVGIK
jgi:hypothetical protein